MRANWGVGAKAPPTAPDFTPVPEPMTMILMGAWVPVLLKRGAQDLGRRRDSAVYYLRFLTVGSGLFDRA